MSYLVAVDPGIRGCGVALFADYRLFHAAYIRNPAKFTGEAGSSERAAMVAAVIEWIVSHRIGAWGFVGELPQIYGSSDAQRNSNDLIQLAAIIGGIENAAQGSVTVSPHAWKGSVNADAMLDRILSRLDSSELQEIEHAGAKTHNAIDAIGIGLHHLGRLNRRRVIAR